MYFVVSNLEMSVEHSNLQMNILEQNVSDLAMKSHLKQDLSSMAFKC